MCVLATRFHCQQNRIAMQVTLQAPGGQCWLVGEAHVWGWRRSDHTGKPSTTIQGWPRPLASPLCQGALGSWRSWNTASLQNHLIFLLAHAALVYNQTSRKLVTVYPAGSQKCGLHRTFGPRLLDFPR